MVMFHSFLYVYQRVNPLQESWSTTSTTTIYNLYIRRVNRLDFTAQAGIFKLEEQWVPGRHNGWICWLKKRPYCRANRPKTMWSHADIVSTAFKPAKYELFPIPCQCWRVTILTIASHAQQKELVDLESDCLAMAEHMLAGTLATSSDPTRNALWCLGSHHRFIDGLESGLWVRLLYMCHGQKMILFTLILVAGHQPILVGIYLYTYIIYIYIYITKASVS